MVAAATLAFVAGCQGEPDILCDRVRVVWPYFELDPTADVDDSTPGLQIAFELRTGFLPGTEIDLFVAGEEPPREHAASAVVDDDGRAAFTGVTVPEGPVSFVLEARNQCGAYETGRSTFVWDGQGFPACGLALTEPGRAAPGIADPVLDAAADADPDEPGFQGTAVVEAGRPDMEITLFVLDLDGGEEEALRVPSGDDGRAELALSLTDGHWAMRAVCLWPPRERRQPSTTRRFVVDTVAPSCELLSPSSAVTASDDLDGDPDNGVQFELVGAAAADDLDPTSARFTVGAEDVAGSLVDAGESTAIASHEGEPPAMQSYRFAVSDLVGNVCEDVVDFATD